jgi:hypothetical protein
MADTPEISWHNDGHKLVLKLNKDQLEILEILCPHDTPEAICHTPNGCVVQNFITQYGLECNIGISDPAAELEICWALQGDNTDIELSQLWFVPVDDEIFHAWKNAR